MSRFIRGKGRFIKEKYTAEEETIEPAKKTMEKFAQRSHAVLRLHVDSWTAFLISQRCKLFRVCLWQFGSCLSLNNIDPKPTFATRWSVGSVKDKGVESKAETHHSSSVALQWAHLWFTTTGFYFPGTHISLRLFTILSSKSLLSNDHVQYRSGNSIPRSRWKQTWIGLCHFPQDAH